jgi:uncharacterized protein
MLRVMRTDVTFEGFGGVRLRGWLYLPDGAGPHPAVVMAHGFSATRHMGLAGFADVFCAAGFAVLVYDHRCLGDSDGEPRQEINPWAQARDYRYASTWLAGQSTIDPERIGIWGSSFSAGEVLVVGAVDPRVKVVIANVPFAGTSTEIPLDGRAERFALMKAALENESGAGPADSTDPPPIGPMQVMVPTGGDPDSRAFLPQPESTEWFEAVGGAGSGWQNTFTLGGFRSQPAFDPAVAVPFIAPRPLLMVVASGDRVAPAENALASYSIAGEPKQLELIDGHHFVPYAGEAFDHAVGVMRDFLLKYL